MVPSTTMVKVPVGVVVVELDAEVTVIEMVSPAPGAGVMVAAERVVFEGIVPEEGEAGHAASKLLKSIEPRPEARRSRKWRDIWRRPPMSNSLSLRCIGFRR